MSNNGSGRVKGAEETKYHDIVRVRYASLNRRPADIRSSAAVSHNGVIYQRLTFEDEVAFAASSQAISNVRNLLSSGIALANAKRFRPRHSDRAS